MARFTAARLLLAATLWSGAAVAGARADDAATRPTTAPAQVRVPAEASDPVVPPPVDRSASLAARREAEAARLGLRRAESASRAAYVVVEQEFRTSPIYRAAVLDLRHAQAAYDRARFPVQVKVRGEPGVADDLQGRALAQEQILELVDAGLVSLGAIQPLATAAMEAGRRISLAEAGAFAAEPTVEQARERMLRSAAVVRELVESHRAALPRDPRIRTSRRDLQTARMRVQRAGDALAEALRDEAQQERARLERIESLRQSGQLPPGFTG